MRLLGAQSKSFARACASLAFALLAGALFCADAQSSLPEAPTPITGNEIAGRIPALDVGDARLTRHFYTLNARPGDLELTVTAANLEGDIDLFSAAAMRPLSKVTLYGGSDTTVSRTVFFRRDETLILRVQARSPNDAEGSYRVRFGGTFVASTAPAPDETTSPVGSSSASSSTPAPGARSNSRGSYRVNSIGARIEEPKTEIAAAPSPTPDETSPAPAPTKPTTARTNTARGRAAARREAARRETARRADTPATRSDAENPEAAKTEPTERAPADGEKTRGASARAIPKRTRAARAPRAGTTDRSAATTDATTPKEALTTGAAEPTADGVAALGLEAPGSRLVLELRDGTRVVREMSDVRRVAIEGRLVVVVLKSGRTERQPLSNIQRMTIEP